MISFTPDSETLLILEQAGFPKDEIHSALIDYSYLITRYPDLVKPSTPDFALFLKTKYYKTAVSVSKNMKGDDIWVPGKAEIEKLEDEGYWREIISSALIDYLTNWKSWENTVSKFAIFRSYLRKKLPLELIISENWYPNAYLIAQVSADLQIEEKIYCTFWDHFTNLVYQNKIEGRFVPRYFYNFVKKNRDKILCKTN